MYDKNKFYTAQESARKALAHYNELRAELKRDTPIMVDVFSELIYWMTSIIESAAEELMSVKMARQQLEEVYHLVHRGEVVAATVEPQHAHRQMEEVDRNEPKN